MVPAAIAGLEQEYGVWVADQQVDFDELIDRVAPRDAVRRFAFDGQARVVRSGAVWTVDAPHAEVATQPRRLGPGIAGRLADDALHERDALARRLRSIGMRPDDAASTELRGYSTHVNAFADGVDGWALAHHFAVTYAPALMLLAERRGSPGLLVRPRPRRLEIGTEYLERREDLVAVSLVVLSATIAAWRTCRDGRMAQPGAARLAPLEAGRFLSTWQRPGLFVPRDAFGDDLYTLVRGARLRTADGGEEIAGQRLRATWRELRPIATTFALPDELAIVDALVDGQRPLPLERQEPQDPPVRRPHRPPRPAPESQVRLLQPRARGRVRVAPEIVTWDQSILRVTHPDRSFYLAVPREVSGRFLEAWAAGDLDTPLEAYAALASTERTAALDVAEAGLFDAVEPQDVAAARLERAKPHGPPSGRRPKQPIVPPPLLLAPRPTVLPRTPVPPGPPTAVTRRLWQRPWVWIVVLVTTLVIWTGGTYLTGSHGGPSPSSGQPCVVVDPNGTAGSCPPSGSPGGQSPAVGSSPSPSGCLPNAPCDSPTPSVGPAASPASSACVPGLPCGSPTAPPSTPPTAPPTRAPTARPTARPTRTPDTSGPRISGLAWVPGTIGVPYPNLQGCSPNSGLGPTVKVTVKVSDPSGVGSVTLRYQRAGDSSPVNAAMSLTGSIYAVVLSTANGSGAWYPIGNDQSYVVKLSVRAVDRLGNRRTTAPAPGFTVTFCQ